MKKQRPEDDPNSMLYWWPRTRRAAVPKPRTILVKTQIEIGPGGPYATPYVVEKIGHYIRRWGPPVFLRTDHYSAKHSYVDTCYYDGTKPLGLHINRLIEESMLADIIGIPVNAIAVREYIPLETGFTAFWGQLPIAKERRYFVRNGQVICHHPYWVEEAIAASRSPLPANWRTILAELNKETPDEIALLTGYAEKIGSKLPGDWSIDFAKGRDDTWYFIDAAVAADSWHPPCPRRNEIGPPRWLIPPKTSKISKIELIKDEEETG